MKYLFHFFGSLFRFAILSLLIALPYAGIRYLLSLLSLVDMPAWSQVWGFAFVLWIFFILYGIGKVIVMAYRFHKEPVFYRAYTEVGMDWKTFKRLKNKERDRKCD